MQENIHTVKILDLRIIQDVSEIFIVTNYVPNNLKKVLSHDNLGLT